MCGLVCLVFNVNSPDYGIKKRDDYFEEKELLGIMKPNTCELLGRPSIGMSEFGEAVEMCPGLIKNLYGEIDLDEVIDYLEDVKELGEMFNNRGSYPHAPTESDLKTSDKVHDRAQ